MHDLLNTAVETWRNEFFVPLLLGSGSGRDLPVFNDNCSDEEKLCGILHNKDLPDQPLLNYVLHHRRNRAPLFPHGFRSQRHIVVMALIRCPEMRLVGFWWMLEDLPVILFTSTIVSAHAHGLGEGRTEYARTINERYTYINERLRLYFPGDETIHGIYQWTVDFLCSKVPESWHCKRESANKASAHLVDDSFVESGDFGAGSQLQPITRLESRLKTADLFLRDPSSQTHVTIKAVPLNRLPEIFIAASSCSMMLRCATWLFRN